MCSEMCTSRSFERRADRGVSGGMREGVYDVTRAVELCAVSVADDEGSG